MKTRESKKTIEKLEKIKRITNPYDALVEIIELYEKFPSHEREVPVRYDQKTGKPSKYVWEEVKPFDDTYKDKNVIFLFHNLSVFYLDLDKRVEKFLENLCKNCPVILPTKNGSYILNQFESSTGPNTIEPTGITFSKLTLELTPAGLERMVKE